MSITINGFRWENFDGTFFVRSPEMRRYGIFSASFFLFWHPARQEDLELRVASFSIPQETAIRHLPGCDEEWVRKMERETRFTDAVLLSTVTERGCVPLGAGSAAARPIIVLC
jgi:hypothetical protein